jgi:transposase
VRIDAGLATFAALSDRIQIANPRHFRIAERRLGLAQRKLARGKKRSGRQQHTRERSCSFFDDRACLS